MPLLVNLIGSLMGFVATLTLILLSEATSSPRASVTRTSAQIPAGSKCEGPGSGERVGRGGGLECLTAR